MSGVLYGLGLGPGDPDLMTLKAHRLIRAARVVAYPAPDRGESFARRIAAGAIRSDATEIAIRVPMRPERGPAQAAYDDGAARISQHLAAGEDVVTLCEGDPFFYGSFMYLHARLAARFPTVVVPGVSSLTACASAAGRPLCARGEALEVLPATLASEDLAQRLAGVRSRGAALAILKLGRHLAKVRRALEAAGLAAEARYVAHASLPSEHACALADAPADAPYFSMILVPGADPHAHP